MYKKEIIMDTLKAIDAEARQIKPYVVIAQPRRDLNETPAQNLNGYERLHIDMLAYSHGFCHIGGEKVDVARNYLIELAIESGAKYLFFVGEDTVIPYDGFLKLHETAEKNPDSMVVGVYYIKLSSPMIMVNKDNMIMPADVERGQVYEAWQSGLDCALIPISLLKKMKEEDPENPFCCIGYKVGDLPFIGEDNYFVYRWRKAGYKLLVNTDVQCLHMDLASGKYTAHHDVNLKDYFTNIPVTIPLTKEDKEYIDGRWVSRLPKGSVETGLGKIETLIKEGKPVKLNLGSGNGGEMEGYISVDKYDRRTDLLMDVCDLKLPENSVDEIFASHLFEHLNPYLIGQILSNWKKILKPDGKLIMEMPDIEGICEEFVKAKDDDAYREGLIMCMYGAVNTAETGGMENITSPHLWGYYPKRLKKLLEDNGFVDVQTMEEQIKHPTKNFRVEAKK